VERTQISLTAGQARELRRLARKRGISMAALIREAVDRTYGIGSADGVRWERALASIGGSRSDRSDVSERHDEHVADAYEA
jgi:ribbon-helix-helix CopG family protein